MSTKSAHKIKVSDMTTEDVFSLCMGNIEVTEYDLNQAKHPMDLDKFMAQFKDTEFEKFAPHLYNYYPKVIEAINDQHQLSAFIKKQEDEKVLNYELIKTLDFFLSIPSDTAAFADVIFKRFSKTLKFDSSYWNMLVMNSVINEIKDKELNIFEMEESVAEYEILNLKDIRYLKEKGWLKSIKSKSIKKDSKELSLMISEYASDHVEEYEIDKEFIEKWLSLNQQITTKKGAPPKNVIIGQLALRLAYLYSLDSFIKDKSCNCIQDFTITNKAIESILTYLESFELYRDYLSNTKDSKIHYISKLIKDAKASKRVKGFYLNSLEYNIDDYKNIILKKSKLNEVTIGLDFSFLRGQVSK